MEYLYTIIGVTSTIITILVTIIIKSYKFGKNKGVQETNISNLDEKFDELKEEFEQEKIQGQKDHKEIRKKIEELDKKYAEKKGVKIDRISTKSRPKKKKSWWD